MKTLINVAAQDSNMYQVLFYKFRPQEAHSHIYFLTLILVIVHSKSSFLNRYVYIRLSLFYFLSQSVTTVMSQRK